METPLEPTQPQKIAAIEQASSPAIDVHEPAPPMQQLDIRSLTAVQPHSETIITSGTEQATPTVTLEISVEEKEPIKLSLVVPKQPEPDVEYNALDVAVEQFDVSEQATKGSFEEIITSLQDKSETLDQPPEIEPTNSLPELPVTETFDILSQVLDQETSEDSIPLSEIVAYCADLEIPLLGIDNTEAELGTEQWVITALTTILEIVGYENPAQLAEKYIADNRPQTAIDMLSYLATLAKSYDAQEKSVAANVASARLASTNKLGSWLLVLLAPRQHTISI